MNFKNLENLDPKGKKVVVRVDFNVPFKPDSNEIADTTRILAAIPTIEHLIKSGGTAILLSHLGRPKGKKDPNLSLKPVAEKLTEILDILDIKVRFCEDFEAVKKVKKGEVAVFENTRFFEGEEKNSKDFSKKLASLGDAFVSDAFGSVHRDHASTVGIAKLIPSYAGFLVEKEVEILNEVIQKPKKPLVLIVGGAKIDTKIGVLKNFIEKADTVLVGGALANTFLHAAGFEVGESLAQKEFINMAQEIMLEAEKHNEKFLIPEDVVVADELGDADDKNPAIAILAESVTSNMKIFDIGPKTREKYSEIIENAGTVVWNGPMGLTEYESFIGGTKAVARSIIKSNSISILGGGDTTEVLERMTMSPEEFTHVSTGGGAMLEFLEGKKLPGLEVLQ